MKKLEEDAEKMRLAIAEKLEKDINPRLSKPILYVHEEEAKPVDAELQGADKVLLVELKTINGQEYIVHKVT